MLITDNPYPLDGPGVDAAPESPGVYSLHLRDEVMFFGVAKENLRETLRAHYEEERGRLDRRAALTGFAYECPLDPDRRRRQLVFQFVAQYGQLPKLNARTREGART